MISTTQLNPTMRHEVCLKYQRLGTELKCLTFRRTSMPAGVRFVPIFLVESLGPNVLVSIGANFGLLVKFNDIVIL